MTRFIFRELYCLVALLFIFIESKGEIRSNLNIILADNTSETISVLDLRSPLFDTISDSYKTLVVDLCNEYVKNSSFFRYGEIHGAFRRNNSPIDNRYEINCSTFSLLISCGINFQNSRYRGGLNKGFFTSEYTDGLIEWFSDGGPNDRNIKYSRDIARKLYEDGYCTTPDSSFSNLDTGDILFFNLDPTNDRPNIDFMGVDHSAIFGYKFGDRFLIYEVGDDKGPKRVLKTAESMRKIVLVSKLPNKQIGLTKIKELASNQEEKTLALSGDGQTNYELAELQLERPLKEGKCYTIVVNAELVKGIWLNATYNGTSSYAFNMTNVRDYRPSDGIYRIHFTAPEDIHTLRMNVRSNVVTQISAVFKSCVLYEGIIVAH